MAKGAASVVAARVEPRAARGAEEARERGPLAAWRAEKADEGKWAPGSPSSHARRRSICCSSLCTRMEVATAASVGAEATAASAMEMAVETEEAAADAKGMAMAPWVDTMAARAVDSVAARTARKVTADRMEVAMAVFAAEAGTVGGAEAAVGKMAVMEVEGTWAPGSPGSRVRHTSICCSS